MEQRYIPLSFTVLGGDLQVRSPLNANIAPPGHYLLFIIDQAGVPSVATFVYVKNSLSSPPPITGAINAALVGTATQSTTSAGSPASLAIDGNTDGNAVNGSVSQTDSGTQPWWQVDLGQVQDIRQIVVNRRSDCCVERLSNFHVIVSALPFTGTDLANTLAQSSISDYYTPGTAAETRIEINRPGRYVRVQLAGQNALDLTEVQVLVDGGGQGVTCGSPSVDPAMDAGVHVWKECGGPWTLMLTGQSNAGSINAVGKIASELGFVSVVPRSIESSDTLASASSTRTDFDLTTSSPWTDHFEFTAVENDELCLGFDRITSNQQLYIGPYRIPAGNGPINPETLQSCEFSGIDCSSPNYDASSDKALLSWVDCARVLHLVGLGGLDYARYSGHVYTSSRFTASSTRSFESSDNLASLSDSNIFFDIGMGGGYSDEILLTPASGDNLCVEIIGQTDGTSLLAGATRTVVTSPFDPFTLQACEPPASSIDCGNPQVDTSSDSALFVWKNCDGTWSVVFTGISVSGGTVNVNGSISSSTGFSSITPADIEVSDSLSTSLINPLSFDMRTVRPYADGFDFTVPDGANLCVSISGVTDGVELVAGPDRTPVGASFDPVTYASCQ